MRHFSLLAPLLAAVLAGPAMAQFGQNKVQYRSFDWRVLETEHFVLYFYSDETAAAHEAARMAERGYAYLSNFFQHEFEDKIPVILYSTHQDFEQSNVIGGFVGEGTGGVTESLKGRVTLPLTGSFAELNHVLVHELVHAFQFDLLNRNILPQMNARSLPLWMMEGMAEWVSNGIDPITAMWVLDAQRADKIPTVQQMSSVQDIRVYRMGQALYEVIGQRYGPGRVRQILKQPERQRPEQPDSAFVPLPPNTATETSGMQSASQPPPAFASETPEGQSLDQLWHAYAESLATKLGQGLVAPDSVAEAVAQKSGYAKAFHLAPAATAAGDRVLFYSSRGMHNELMVAERSKDGWKGRSLVAGEQSAEHEALPLLSASADWSPDEKTVVFVATQQGRDMLQILDFRRRKVIRQIKTDLQAIANPSFSPDGRWVVFSGLHRGHGDLFAVEVETGDLVRLTQDAYSERTPRFSPDGNTLVFATDRGPETDLDGLVFGTWNIGTLQLRHDARGDLVPGEITVIVATEADDFAPVWSPDGQTIAFVSDRSGTYQVHTFDLATGELRQRTRFASGVIGIIPTGPAVSWSRSNDIFYSVFDHGGWHLYRTTGWPEDLPSVVDSTTQQLVRSKPAAIYTDANTRLDAEERDYKARLTPEYAVVGALYIGNSGAAGSGQLLLGDMLGNQYLLLSGYLRTDFDQSEILVQYANIGRRLQWGLAGFQYRDDILVYSSPTRSNVESTVFRGVGAQLYYPFNRFRRIEFQLDFRNETVRSEVWGTVGDSLGSLEVIEERVGTYNYTAPGLALVHDNTSYSGFTPVSGGRWRIEGSKAFGELDYTLAILDWRRYLNVHRRGALALRVITASSWGLDQRLLYIGGPETFRGTDFGGLAGTRIAFANVEARFPLFAGTELVRGVVFFDAATSWYEDQSYADQHVQTAFGFGVRAYVGLPLRFDAAMPISTDPNNPFSQSKDWKTFFAIGFDY